jgi:hypothetical protein
VQIQHELVEGKPRSTAGGWSLSTPNGAGPGRSLANGTQEDWKVLVEDQADLGANFWGKGVAFMLLHEG